MKRFLLLLLPLLFLSGCSWIGNNQADVEKISQLEQQLSGLMAQVSGLQQENELLRASLSGSGQLASNNMIQTGAIQTNQDESAVVTIGDNKDVKGQITLIKRLLQKDGKWFGEFDYLQYPSLEYMDAECGGTPSGCYQNENPKIRTIEIDENGTFSYFVHPLSEDPNLQTTTTSFNGWYENEHPYTGVRPKMGDLDSAFIITVRNGKVIEIGEDYTS